MHSSTFQACFLLVSVFYGATASSLHQNQNGTRNRGQTDELDLLERIQKLESTVKTLQESCPRPSSQEEQSGKLDIDSRQISHFVAFTAYLDHTIEHLGVYENVAYNKVLLNAGGAYSPNTGVFTVPRSGYYAFSFYVYTNGVQQFVARLTVDGHDQVDGIADTYFENHEAQGGNFVVLYLQAGQKVAIQNERWADKAIDSTGGSRMSTFSGYLIQG